MTKMDLKQGEKNGLRKALVVVIISQAIGILIMLTIFFANVKSHMERADDRYDIQKDMINTKVDNKIFNISLEHINARLDRIERKIDDLYKEN